jgi:hypothetical protein
MFVKSFQELIFSHLPSSKMTKFKIYLVCGGINCFIWVWLAISCQRYCVKHFHLPLTGPSCCQLKYHNTKVGKQIKHEHTQCARPRGTISLTAFFSFFFSICVNIGMLYHSKRKLGHLIPSVLVTEDKGIKIMTKIHSLCSEICQILPNKGQ